MPKRRSKWERFKEKWKDGCGSSLCPGATKVCLARGSVPSDVVLIGEAPGVGEDVIGSPFVGKAGHLLDHILSQGIPKGVTYSLTNLVGCIPRGDDGEKFTMPDKKDIKQCSDRLYEYLILCDPQLVISVGALAAKYVNELTHDEFNPHIVDIIHPAAILRMNIAAHPLEIKRAVVRIREGVVRAGLLP